MLRAKLIGYEISELRSEVFDRICLRLCRYVPSALPDDYPVEEEGSRKAAKAQRKREIESREPTLCVSAPLREVLLCLSEV